MELFHYEWDSNELNKVLTKKEKIQKILFSMDGQKFANFKLKYKDEWIHLNFVGQSKGTTEQLKLPKKKFKLVTWQ